MRTMRTIAELLNNDDITIGGIKLVNVYIPRADVLALNLASDETLFIAMGEKPQGINQEGFPEFQFYADEELEDKFCSYPLSVRY